MTYPRVRIERAPVRAAGVSLYRAGGGVVLADLPGDWLRLSPGRGRGRGRHADAGMLACAGDHLEQRVYDGRVELGAAVGAQLRQSRLQGERLAVGAVGPHRVPGVAAG